MGQVLWRVGSCVAAVFIVGVWFNLGIKWFKYVCGKMLRLDWKEKLQDEARVSLCYDEGETHKEEVVWLSFIGLPENEKYMSMFNLMLKLKLIETLAACQDNEEKVTVIATPLSTRSLQKTREDIISLIHSHREDIREWRNTIVHSVFGRPPKYDTIWESFESNYRTCELLRLIKRLPFPSLHTALGQDLNWKDMMMLAIVDILSVCREEVYRADRSDLIWKLFRDCDDIVQELGLENSKRINQLRNIVCHKYKEFIEQEKNHHVDIKKIFNEWIEEERNFDDCMDDIRTRIDGFCLTREELSRLNKPIHMGHVLHLLWNSKFKIRPARSCKQVAENMRLCLGKVPDLLSLPTRIIDVLKMWESSRINQTYTCKLRNIGALLSYVGISEECIDFIYFQDI